MPAGGGPRGDGRPGRRGSPRAGGGLRLRRDGPGGAGGSRGVLRCGGRQLRRLRHPRRGLPSLLHPLLRPRPPLRGHGPSGIRRRSHRRDPVGRGGLPVRPHSAGRSAAGAHRCRGCGRGGGRGNHRSPFPGGEPGGTLGHATARLRSLRRRGLPGAGGDAHRGRLPDAPRRPHRRLHRQLGDPRSHGVGRQGPAGPGERGRNRPGRRHAAEAPGPPPLQGQPRLLPVAHRTRLQPRGHHQRRLSPPRRLQGGLPAPAGGFGCSGSRLDAGDRQHPPHRGAGGPAPLRRNRS